VWLASSTYVMNECVIVPLELSCAYTGLHTINDSPYSSGYEPSCALTVSTRAIRISQLRSAYEGATYTLATSKRFSGVYEDSPNTKPFRRSQGTHEGPPTIALTVDSFDIPSIRSTTSSICSVT
jgi:hypothetical protein